MKKIFIIVVCFLLERLYRIYRIVKFMLVLFDMEEALINNSDSVDRGIINDLDSLIDNMFWSVKPLKIEYWFNQDDINKFKNASKYYSNKKVWKNA